MTRSLSWPNGRDRRRWDEKADMDAVGAGGGAADAGGLRKGRGGGGRRGRLAHLAPVQAQAQLTRGGQTLDALLCVYDDGAALYLDDAVQTNVGTLSFPAQMEGAGERFLSGDFADLDSDGNSDAALRFTQEDGSEIVMTWLWDVEAEGYVFRDAADAG